MSKWAKLLKLCLPVLMSILVSTSYGQAINHSDTGANNNSENLTDEERHIKENYVHQGLTQRKKDELCKGDNDTDRACMGLKAQKKFMGMSPTLMQGVSKAYAMIIGMSDIGGGLVTEKDADAKKTGKDKKAKEKPKKKKTAKKDSKGKKDDAKDEDEDETDDYCKYIAVATETIATIQQTSEQENISSIPVKKESAQKEALYKAEQSHRARADNAKIQKTGWMATTACYTAYMATGFQGVSMSAGPNLAKLGAAALLWKFFDSQQGAHEDYANKVSDIAAKLPGKGDCNPVSDRNCYCAQKETQYDPKYCKDVINKRKMAATSVAVSCIDEKLKSDPSCKCAATNTCYDQKFLTNVKGFNFGNAQEQSAVSPFKSLARGELKGGKLSGGSAKQFAIVDKALKNSSNKLGGLDKPLTKNQKQEAKALVDAFGISKKLASHIAAQPVSKASKKAISKYSGGSGSSSGTRRSSYNRNRGSNKVLTFGGGGGINKRKKKSRSSDDFMKRFGLKKKRGKSSGRGKVMKFAKRAERSAQITRNKDRPLFEIISRRYQVSGWRRLELVK